MYKKKLQILKVQIAMYVSIVDKQEGGNVDSKQDTENAAPKKPDSKKIGYSALSYRYGMTNAFSTLVTTMVSMFWAVYLTSAGGLDTLTMATVLSVASIVDLISIPILGVVLQKARLFGGKYGIFRPWLVIGGVCCALFAWLRFTNLGFTGIGGAVWFGGAYILCNLAFNLAYSAFTGILPLMARTPNERVTFASARITCNSIGKFLFSLCAVTLVAWFGQGNDVQGYSLLALLVSVLMAFGFIQLFFVAKKYDVIEKNTKAESEKAGDQYSASIWEMIKFTITKPFLLYLLAAVCKASMYFIVTGLAAYYYTYVIGDKTMLTVFLSLSTFLMIGGSFIAPFINRLCHGARNTFAVGISIYGICLGLAFFFGNTAISFTVLMCVGYVGYAFAHSSEAAFYTSVVDYTEWKRDKDLKPFMMTLFSLTPKIGTAVGSAVLGFGLVAIGFDANAVTAAASSGLRTLFSGLPAGIAIISVVAMLICPLSEKKVDQMQSELAARRAARAEKSAGSPAE